MTRIFHRPTTDVLKETLREAGDAEWAGDLARADALYAEAKKYREKINNGENYVPTF